jgi:hypothetical protein
MFRVFVVCVLALACACGDDDDGNDKAAAAGSSAGAAANGGRGGSSTGTGTGTGKEGAACQTSATCSSNLKCVVAALLQDQSGTLGIPACARPCKDAATDCQQGETCRTLTGDPSDSFCRSVTTEAFKPCGAGDTSVCAEPLTCFTLQEEDGSLQGGVCFQPCALPGAMFTTPPPPCTGGQTCVDALGDPEIGACAQTVGRGEVCDPDATKFCDPSDFCITAANSDISHCLQNCTKDGTCADGKTCTPLSDGDKFCQ